MPARSPGRRAAPRFLPAVFVFGLFGALAVVWWPEEARAESRTESSVAVRRALLRDHLKIYPERAALERYFPAIWGATTLAISVGFAISENAEDESGRSRWVFAGTAGAVSAVSFGSYAVSADYRSTALELTVGLLVAGTGAGFYASSRATPTLRFSCATVMATGLAYGGLAVTDAALERPVSAATLARHYDGLEHGGSVRREDDFAKIEGDFKRVERPIPRWKFPLIYGLGGLIASVPVLSSKTSADDKSGALALGGMLLIPALISLVPSFAATPYGSYKDSLGKVQLAPVGPAGSTGFTVASQF